MLRNNQLQPVSLGIDFFSQPNEPAIITMPVAAGKSHVIANIVDGINDKVLIISPTVELLQQNIQKFRDLGKHAVIHSASAGQKLIDKVVYATIGSIYQKGEYFKKMGFTKMIIDECHSYPRGSGMLRTFIKDAGITHSLGFTATPFKLVQYLNGKIRSNYLQMLTNMGDFYKSLLHVTPIKDMLDNGYWSPFVYEQYDTDTSRLRFNSTRSDYTEESLNEVYYGNNIEQNIVNRIKNCNRKSIIVFVPNVSTAIYLSKKVDNSVAVYGEMDKKLRKEYIDKFKAGEIRVIFNVNVLSIGFDSPNVDCIILARPTASLAMFYQQQGRGARIHPDKKDCLVVDFSGNVKRFGRIENLEYRKLGSWHLYGENNKLLTGIPF